MGWQTGVRGLAVEERQAAAVEIFVGRVNTAGLGVEGAPTPVVAVNASIEAVHTATNWPRRSDRILATARATYLWLPEGTRLWRRGLDFEPLDAANVRSLLDAIT